MQLEHQRSTSSAAQTEGTPDLPKMIDDEGFTEDKDYMKWVIEKAAESYAKEFGIID